MEFKLGEEQYIFKIPIKNRNEDNCTSLSAFDQILQSRWNAATEAGLCRYRLGMLQTKILPGKFAFIAQLNPERAKQRRTPQNFKTVKAMFNSEEFNFNKVPEHEILMRLGKNAHGADHIIIINVSPLEFGHSLLVPSVQANIPQQATFEGLLLLFKIILCSSNINLKAGFNSPGGYASVNHQHYHLYYLKQELFIETVQVEPIVGPCYALTKFPSKGFAFQLERDIESLARNVFSLVSYLRDNEIAHNLFVTRGIGYETTSGVSNTIRVFVWAREPTFGAKEEYGFNPALCELAGHILVKESSAYETITESEIHNLLNGLTEPWFQLVCPKVREIFSPKSDYVSKSVII